MNGVMKKIKWFVIVTLIVLVGGMTVFGVMGFNDTVDYKPSYEMQVSVDQSIEQAKTILKTSADKYLLDNGISHAEYAYQEMDDGKVLVYKFCEDVTERVSGLKEYIDTALQGDEVAKGALATVEVNQVDGDNFSQICWILLGIGITLVVAFLYTLIMEKLASAVAVLCSSVVSFLLFFSLMALTRLPAATFVGALSAVSVALSAALSVTTVNAYKSEIKESVKGKISHCDIADKVAKKECKKYLFALIIALVSAVAISAFLVPYMMILGAQIAIASVSAVVAAYFTTPLIWTLIKKDKKA